MPYFTAFTAVSLAISAAAFVVPRTTWPAAFEQYDVYHARYMALDCASEHDTLFFDQCCHPLKAGQSPPAECNSNVNLDDNNEEEDGCDGNGNTTSWMPLPTTTPTSGNHEDGCDGDYNSTTTSVSLPTTTKLGAPTNTPGNLPASAVPILKPDSGVYEDGFATYFYQNGVEGACGHLHKDSELVAALAGYNNGAYCGRQISLTNTENDKTVTVTVADECPTCENVNCVDLSVAAFKQLGDLSTGMLQIKWSFIS